ncbi:MAG: hypothetical protein JNL59_08640 [Chitinophagaceae bacterium]|jgi:hypothetical protein|nr:hypothetical protein [Chitinophagaceae bacterium]
MYNPFVLLSPELLAHKIAAGKRFFVRQTYLRGLQPGIRAAFLFRAYPETEKEPALQHLQAINSDRHAHIYDITEEDELQKLRIAAAQPAGYRIYYAGKIGTKWRPPPVYEYRIRQYIRRRHPEWRPTRGLQIRIGLFEKWGNLWIRLEFEEEIETIPLSQFEMPE